MQLRHLCWRGGLKVHEHACCNINLTAAQSVDFCSIDSTQIVTRPCVIFHTGTYEYKLFETGRRPKEQAVDPGALPPDWFGHGPPCGEEESEHEEPEPRGLATALEAAVWPVSPTCRHDPPIRLSVRPLRCVQPPRGNARRTLYWYGFDTVFMLCSGGQCNSPLAAPCKHIFGLFNRDYVTLASAVTLSIVLAHSL